MLTWQGLPPKQGMSDVGSKAENINSISVIPILTRLYGPAARCKRFRQPGQLRSCINVSGL
jgi:hypothetical protein